MAAGQPSEPGGNHVITRRGRTRQCNRADAGVRLDDASRFLAAGDALATTAIDVGNDVLATNAIHAAIAAAYETRGTTDEEVKTCRRVAARLIEAAQQTLQAAGPT